MTRRHKKRKIDDRRGKHTKQSRLRQLEERERYLKSLERENICEECGTKLKGDTTSDGDREVCHGCGMVQDNVVLDKQVEGYIAFNEKSLYLHRNYFSERMSQWVGRDPVFSSSERSAIHSCWSKLHETNPYIWSNSRYSWSKSKFGEICRLLDACQPNKNWKKKIEKWTQAETVIYGTLDNNIFPDDGTIEEMKILFDPIAFVFNKYFKDKNGKHNIPKLDIICLILLYNISENSLKQYGWYFLNEFIVWESESMILAHQRTSRILKFINENWFNIPHVKFVREDALKWLLFNKYKIPTLQKMCDIIRCSEKGQSIIEHLYIDNKNKFIFGYFVAQLSQQAVFFVVEVFVFLDDCQYKNI